MTKHTDYECPRCGYKSNRKPAMRKHFYEVKKPCPGIMNLIDLTDDIKQTVLNNRVYHIPKVEHPIINNLNVVVQVLPADQ
jgi:hypothetical protein